MTGHKDRAHAILSASGAHRWMHCTPSAKLEEQFPDTTFQAAKEGTLAHEIAEAKLLHYFDTLNFKKSQLKRRLNKAKKSELYASEMEHFTDEYLDFAKASAMAYDATPHVAIEKRLDLTEYIPGGFGTADCVIIGDGVLHIIDLKYGKGVPVSAENNPQMMIYALGAIKAYELVYAIHTVKMSIVQPRIDNTNTWEISAKDLLAFGETVKETAAIAIEGKGEYKPGDWCRFCRARAQCRARAEENVKLAFHIDKKPPLITNDEVGEYLVQGADIAQWLKELQDYALTECLAGKEVAGWKAVEGRGSRVWADADKAYDIILESGVPEEMLFVKTPLTLAQTEKLMGKKEFQEVVGDFVEKKPGKPTLVKKSDKRKAITNVITADEAFEK